MTQDTPGTESKDKTENTSHENSEWIALNDESRDIWNQNAGFWDDFMGDSGNRFHRELVAPTAERLLALQPGESVLEIACGAGLFARQMAQAGANVYATDFSVVFIERAKQRAGEYAGKITFQVLDATNAAQLLALGVHRFEAVVCNMALMDMPTIEPLFSALPHLLKPGGRFVFTIMHPCFNGHVVRVVEEYERNGEIELVHALKISQYRTVKPKKGIGVQGQPVPQFYFHRPLSVLLGAGFRAGFVVDGIEEPAFVQTPDNPRSLHAGNFSELPMVLAVRFRLPYL
jgi:2-polyprenyl-3-methyl-5-hydroxy-6-metoxy-1,4-benzoquinol methylase